MLTIFYYIAYLIFHFNSSSSVYLIFLLSRTRRTLSKKSMFFIYRRRIIRVHITQIFIIVYTHIRPKLMYRNVRQHIFPVACFDHHDHYFYWTYSEERPQAFMFKLYALRDPFSNRLRLTRLRPLFACCWRSYNGDRW